MKAKSFLTLLVLAALASAGAWWLVLRPTPQADTALPGEAGGRLAPALAERADEIVGITVVRAGEATGPALELGEDGVWRLASKGGFPAAPDRVRRLVTTLSELRTVEPKTGKPELFDRLALQWPDEAQRSADDFGARPTLVRVTDGAGDDIAAIVLGETTFERGESRQYARLLEGGRAWLVSGVIDVPEGELGFVEKRFAELPRDSVKTVTVTHKDGAALTLTRDDPEGDFVVDGIPEGMTMTNEGLANSTGNALAFVNFTDIEAEAPGAWASIPDPSAVGGLLGDDEVAAQFVTFDGLRLLVVIEPVTEGGRVGGGWASVHAEGEGSGPITDRFGGYRFLLPSGVTESLTRRPSELLVEAGSLSDEEAGPALPGPGLPPPSDG